MAMYSVFAHDGRAYGPVDEAGLAQWAREGRLTAFSQIRCEPGGQIVQAGSLPFLAPILGPGTAIPPMWNQVIPFDSPMAAMHQLSSFSVVGVVLLQLVTLGIFSTIWFGLMHDKMPRLRHDDPSAGKAIGFMFIPFFNLYWMFFAYCRLCDRIAEQRRFRGLPEGNLKGLAIGTCVVAVIPYVNFFIGFPIMWPLFFGLLQSRVNELVSATAAAAGWQGGQP